MATSSKRVLDPFHECADRRWIRVFIIRNKLITKIRIRHSGKGSSQISVISVIKNRNCDCSQSKQLPLTDQKTEIAPYFCTYVRVIFV